MSSSSLTIRRLIPTSARANPGAVCERCATDACFARRRTTSWSATVHASSTGSRGCTTHSRAEASLQPLHKIDEIGLKIVALEDCRDAKAGPREQFGGRTILSDSRERLVTVVIR